MFIYEYYLMMMSEPNVLSMGKTFAKFQKEGTEEPEVAQLVFKGPFKDHAIKLHTKPPNTRHKHLDKNCFVLPL